MTCAAFRCLSPVVWPTQALLCVGVARTPCQDASLTLSRIPKVGYKNYVGTVGAEWEPLLVSDRVCSPPEFASHYSEHLLLLPRSFYGERAVCVCVYVRVRVCVRACQDARTHNTHTHTHTHTHMRTKHYT